MYLNIKRLCFVTLLLLVTVSGPARAEKTWWDVFFPSNRNIPAETLRAPFADADAVIAEPEDGSVLVLDVPHRPRTEIAEWVEKKVSDLIVYDANSYQAEYKSKIKDFDTAGSSEYLKFLQGDNILKSLSTKSYDIRGFAQDLPIILNEGPLNGRYRWLLQIPIMVTFVKAGNSYKQTKLEEALNKEYVVNLQVGRSDSSSDEIGLLIEAWKATPVKEDIKE